MTKRTPFPAVASTKWWSIQLIIRICSGIGGRNLGTKKMQLIVLIIIT